MHIIGIDAVDIARFTHWNNYRYSTLIKVFSNQEICYCLSNKLKSAERFAVRFAAKEALYKAIFKIFKYNITLLEFFKYVEIIKNPTPYYKINFEKLHLDNNKFKEITLSLTHTKEQAHAACLIIYEEQ